MSGEWHAEARRLRAEGMSKAEIGRRFGKSDDAVRWALDENGRRTESHMKIIEFRRVQQRAVKEGKPVNLSRQQRIADIAQRHVAGKINLAQFNAELRQAYTETRA